MHERNKKGDEENAPASPRFGTFAHTRPLFDLKTVPPRRPYTQSQPESVPQDSIIRNRGPINSGRRLLVRTDYTVYFSEREFVVEMPSGSGSRSGSGSIDAFPALSSSSSSSSLASPSDEKKDGNNSPERNDNTNENILKDRQKKVSNSTDKNQIYRGGYKIVNSTYLNGVLDNSGDNRIGIGRNTQKRVRRGLLVERNAGVVYNNSDGHAHRHHGRNESKESREIRRERHKQRDLQWGRNRTNGREKYRDRDGNRDQDKMRDREREMYRGRVRDRSRNSDTSFSSSDRHSILLPRTDGISSRSAIRAEEGRQAGEGEYTTVELPLSLSAIMHYRYCCHTILNFFIFVVTFTFMHDIMMLDMYVTMNP